VDDVDAEGTEAVRRVEARLTHRAVALVEELGERIARLVVVEREVVVGHLVRAVVLAHAVVVRSALLVDLVGQHLRRGAAAEVEVTREAGFGDEVRRARPEVVVLLDRGEGRAQPLAVLRLSKTPRTIRVRKGGCERLR
jgi:hypothetical protein